MYDALQLESDQALTAVQSGETHLQKQWRLASRLCHQFLAAPEESARLALTSQIGSWQQARLAVESPENHYTYLQWLAAQCRQDNQLQEATHF